MAETARRSALTAVLEPGIFGVNVQQPAVTLAEGPAVSLAERRPAALLRLCAALDDSDFASVVRSMTALALPHAPNTAMASDGRALLWLAPGQWLLVDDGEQGAIGEQQLQAGLNKTCGTVVDVSHAYLVLRIGGERARDVLAKGVPIDVDAVVFDVGACAQTCLADMNVLLHARHTRVIDLYVGRSYAASLWEWLRLSAAEFGYRVAGAAEG